MQGEDLDWLCKIEGIQEWETLKLDDNIRKRKWH